jgi:hypothetical protein
VGVLEVDGTPVIVGAGVGSATIPGHPISPAKACRARAIVKTTAAQKRWKIFICLLLKEFCRKEVLVKISRPNVLLEWQHCINLKYLLANHFASYRKG